jgi:preprotein translocase subunit SecG
MTLLTVFHVLACIILILVVLLQSGKAGDLASAFGGTTSQAAFGARSAATLLTKGTAVCAVIFMVTSLGLAILFTQGTESTVMEDVPVTGEAPETPPAEAVPEDQR